MLTVIENPLPAGWQSGRSVSRDRNCIGSEAVALTAIEIFAVICVAEL